MHIGKSMLAAREQLGVSQESLAKKLKIRVKTLNTIEQMEYHSDHAVGRVAKALGVSTDFIYGFNKGD